MKLAPTKAPTPCCRQLTDAEVAAVLAQLPRAVVDQVARADALERAYFRVLVSTWSKAWGRARAALFEALPLGRQPTSVDMRKAVNRAGAVFADPEWVPQAARVQLVRIRARAYNLGVGVMVEEAISRGRSWAPTGDGRRRSLAVERACAAEATRATLVPVPPLAESFAPEMDYGFSVTDRRAAAHLANDSMFWVGNVWTNALGQQIAGTAMGAITAASSRAEVVKNLQNGLARFGRSEGYWNVVANAAIVRARSMGAVVGMRKAAVSDWEFVAVVDNRTTQVCQDMDGTVFTVEHAEQHMERFVNAKSPEEAKAISPWVTDPAKLEGMGADALAAAGVMLPPLHGNCRSTMVANSFQEEVTVDSFTPTKA